jgi:mannose-6-phosphate isomerase-like protein (cupin superfamily)
MMRIVFTLALAALCAAAAPDLATRVVHTDPAKFRQTAAVHGGAGSMNYSALLGASALETNLIFLHRGMIQPKSGIGAHFHNECEEMFVILEGEAEFTIDGRTAVLPPPAGAPTRAGHSHGIYNPGDKPIQWININVGMTKSYDAFNLNDPRVGATVEKIPPFMSMHLDRAQLKPVNAMNGGTGTVQYRRALGPSVFSSPWSYVDHLQIPVGASVGPDAQADMSEVYYVIAGEGSVSIDGQTAPLRTGDAIAIHLGERKAFAASRTAPLEVMIIGVARDLAAKRAFAAIDNPPRR